MSCRLGGVKKVYTKTKLFSLTAHSSVNAPSMEYQDREPQVAFFNSQIEEDNDEHVLENYENRQSVIKFKDVGDEEDDLEGREVI